MPTIPFADNFLAGSIISLLLPVGLLIVISVWYWRAVRRIPEDTDAPQPSLGATEPSASAATTTETPPGGPGGNIP
jgi:hypothetical protein